MDELILYQLKDEIYRLDPSLIGGKVRFNGITLDYTNNVPPGKRGG